MASQMAILSRARKTILKTLNHHNNPFKASISTFTFLSQEPQLVEPSLPPPFPTPLSPNPTSGSPLYSENWWSPIPQAQSIIPLGFLLSVDEGLVVSALGTAGRTYSYTLLDTSWAILRRSLRQKKAPQPESYLAKIYADAALGNLQRAFSTLHEFETTYRNSPKEAEEDIFSPFTSLHPLVMASSKKGFETLDTICLLICELILEVGALSRLIQILQNKRLNIR